MMQKETKTEPKDNLKKMAICPVVEPQAVLEQTELENRLVLSAQLFLKSGRKFGIRNFSQIEKVRLFHQHDHRFAVTETLLKQISLWVKGAAKVKEPIVLDVSGMTNLYSRFFAKEGLVTIYIDPSLEVLQRLAKIENLLVVDQGVWKDQAQRHYYVLADAQALADVFALNLSAAQKTLLGERAGVFGQLRKSLAKYDQGLKVLHHYYRDKSLALYHQLLGLDDLIDQQRYQAFKEGAKETPISLVFSAYFSRHNEFINPLKNLLPRALVFIEEKLLAYDVLLPVEENLPNLNSLDNDKYRPGLISGPNYVELINVDVPSPDLFHSDSFILHCRKDLVC